MGSWRDRYLVLLVSVFLASFALLYPPALATQAGAILVDNSIDLSLAAPGTDLVQFATGYSQTVSWRFMVDRINDYRRKVPPYQDRFGEAVAPLVLDTSLRFSSLDKAINYPYLGQYNNDPRIHIDKEGLTVSERLYRNWWIPRGTRVSEVVFYTSKMEWDGYMGAMRFWGYESAVHMKILRDPGWSRLGVGAAYTKTPVNNTARTYPSVYIAEFSAAY